MTPWQKRILADYLLSIAGVCLCMSIASVNANGAIKRNGKIAFTSDRDGNREIYVMNADGTNQTRLTNNTIVDDHPTWSPDGSKIAFVSERATGGRAIFTMKPDGTGRTEVTPVNYVDRYPSWPILIWTDFYSMDWSPDGTQIVFQDNYDIVIVDVDGSNRHTITDGAGAYDVEPAWSPDGSKILFARDPVDDGGLMYLRMSTMNVDGSDLQFLPNAWQGQEGAPRWSPRGDKIVFVIEFTDDIPTSVLYLTNADGSNDQLFDGSLEVYENEYRNKPTWSPDGTGILFDKWVLGTSFPGDLEIYVKKVNGAGLTQLTNTNGWNFNPSWQPLANKSFDFDGDGRSDVSVFRPSDSVWYLNRSAQGFSATHFGLSADRLAPADYDGDGKTDIAIFRDGVWWWLNSSSSTIGTLQFGLAGDIPVPADYTGDGHDEIALYRGGQWWTMDLSNGSVGLFNFGVASDHPVPGDYDGDGKIGAAIFRPGDGQWWILRSSGGLFVTGFGTATDIAVPADHSGDGKTDIAVFRPSTGEWFVLRSEDQSYYAFPFGQSGDIPAPADYDGDGRADAAVFRNGIWYLNQTTSGISIQQFGLGGDKPVPSALIQQ